MIEHRLGRYGYAHIRDQQCEPLFTHCPVTGKIRHASRSRAKRHIKSLRRHSSTGKEAYVCTHCGGWHVGRSWNVNRPVNTTKRGTT